jgi:iron(III) transport system ATP-binding protein
VATSDREGKAREPYLEIDRLTKRFDAFAALDDISLAIDEGEFVCFLGPSGCGKTTLLRAIAGLDIQSAGRIVQADRDISALPAAERDFGIVFQSYALFPNLKVRRNIAYGLENKKLGRARIRERVDELLDLVGLAEHSEKYPAQLSGGQQQRVALARALATSPGLLLLDEPLSALDAKVRTYLRQEIKHLQHRLGVTTVMVTHDQEEALTMADRIVVMNHGRIEQVGTPEEIYRDPTTLFVADFIGAMNQVPVRAASAESVLLGELELRCRRHEHPDGAPVILTIRPEDIVPGENGEGAATSSGGNTLDVTIGEMEFLGSFWRAVLTGEALGDATLLTDLSSNAVRRLGLAEGLGITIELPTERLKVFAA